MGGTGGTGGDSRLISGSRSIFEEARRLIRRGLKDCSLSEESEFSGIVGVPEPE